MAIGKVYKSGGSFVFVVRRAIREKYNLKVGDKVDYILQEVISKKEVNEVVEGITIKNISGSYVLRIPYDIIKIYGIEKGDYIRYEIKR